MEVDLIDQRLHRADSRYVVQHLGSWRVIDTVDYSDNGNGNGLGLGLGLEGLR